MILDSNTGEITHIHNYAIAPNAITRYSQSLSPSNYQSKILQAERLRPASRPKSELSTNAKRKLTKSISWLTFLSKEITRVHPLNYQKIKHQLAFITLTLPARQQHSDAEIKKVALNQFLTEMRQDYDMRNYIWKAELQKNGNVHFHFITDTFIDYRALRAVWNRCINRLGYVDRYAAKFSAMSLQEYLSYRNCSKLSEKLAAAQHFKSQKKVSWSEPNSTDIRKVRNIKNLAAYVRKYLVKPVDNPDDSSAPPSSEISGLPLSNPANHDNAVPGKLYCSFFSGRIWGRSQSLSKLQAAHELEQSTFETALKRHISEKKVHIIREDYYEVVCVEASEADGAFGQLLNQLLHDYANEQGYISYAQFCQDSTCQQLTIPPN